jgi:hypothetical protein
MPSTSVRRWSALTRLSDDPFLKAGRTQSAAMLNTPTNLRTDMPDQTQASVATCQLRGGPSRSLGVREADATNRNLEMAGLT